MEKLEAADLIEELIDQFDQCLAAGELYRVTNEKSLRPSLTGESAYIWNQQACGAAGEADKYGKVVTTLAAKLASESECRTIAPELLEMHDRLDRESNPMNWPVIKRRLRLHAIDLQSAAAMELRKSAGPTQLKKLGRPSDTDKVNKLPKRAIDAIDQYQNACELLKNDKPQDRNAYVILSQEYEKNGGVHPLPAFATWTSYLRIWRRATDQQKRTPRAGRPTGSSIVKSIDL